MATNPMSVANAMDMASLNPVPATTPKIEYVRIVSTEYDCRQCGQTHRYERDDDYHTHYYGEKRWIVEVVNESEER